RALTALWPTPVTRGLLRVLRSVHLDRILLGAALGVSVAALALLLPMSWWMPMSLALVGAGGSYFVWSNRQRITDLDASQAMRRGAQRIAQLLDVRFIVMGHTHRPIAERIDEGSTYVNLGNWGADDPEPDLGWEPP